ncbi:hypothetical protein [Spirochaeta dissipatitropha]
MKKLALYLSVLLGFAGLLSGCGVLGGHSEYARVIRGVWTPDGKDLLMVVWRFEATRPNHPYHANDSIRNSRIEGYLVGRSRISSWEDGRWLDAGDLLESERVFHFSDTEVPGSNSVADGLAGESYYYNTYFVNLGGTKGYRAFMGSGHHVRIIDFKAGSVLDFKVSDIKLPENQIKPLLDNHILGDLWPYFGIRDMVPSADGQKLAVFGQVGYYPDPDQGINGPLYFNNVMTFFDAGSPQSAERVLRFSEDAPEVASGQSWPDDPDQQIKFPIAATVSALYPYSILGERLNYSYMSSVDNESGKSFVLIRSVPGDDAAVLLPFQPENSGDITETVQRYALDSLPDSIQIREDYSGEPVPHASGPVRHDNTGVEVEIPDLTGEKTRFRLRKL